MQEILPQTFHKFIVLMYNELKTQHDPTIILSVPAVKILRYRGYIISPPVHHVVLVTVNSCMEWLTRLTHILKATSPAHD